MPSNRDRELFKTYTALPKAAIARGALLKAFTELSGFLLIPVDFPHAAGFIIVPVVYKASDVLRRVAQEESNLMGKVLSAAKALHQMAHTGGAA